jgi:hypothetical protein
VTGEQLCNRSFTDEEVNRLQDAIEDLYYFEFVIGEFEYADSV